MRRPQELPEDPKRTWGNRLTELPFPYFSSAAVTLGYLLFGILYLLFGGLGLARFLFLGASTPIPGKKVLGHLIPLLILPPFYGCV